MSIFSLVVARENSKGLPQKTIQKINNKYVFEYTIEYSLALSNIVPDDVVTVVSSDVEIIADYCSQSAIPFIQRKPELASDAARIEDVIYDAYTTVARDYAYISLLYGNIPTRYTDEFLRAYEFMEKNAEYDAVLSMQNVEKFNPAWMFEYNTETLPMKIKEGYRRQDLKQYMIHDSHTILVRSDYFIKAMSGRSCGKVLYDAFGKKIKPLLNNKVVIDIDTAKDLEIAESLLKGVVLKP